MAAASAADDGVYPIALDWQTFTGCQPYGFDIGNTLCKLIYRPKEYDQPSNEEEKAAKKWHLRFCKFPLSAIEDMISFIQHNCDLASQTENFMCCGLGSIGFNKRIQEALNIKYAAHQPGEQTVQTLGLTFLASRLALADFTAPHDPSAEDAALSVAHGYYGRIPGGCRESRSSDWPENGRVQFPCMVFLGGSGSCCMKISDEGEVSRQEMFWLSGKAFDVMYTLATGAKSFPEFISLAEKGDAMNTDFLLRELPLDGADDATRAALAPMIGSEDAPAGRLFFFGKVANDLGNIDQYSKADLAASLVGMWTATMVTYVAARAREEGCKQVILYGSFFDHSIIRKYFTYNSTMHNMTWMNLHGEEPIQYHYVREGGFLGALGCVLYPVYTHKHSAQYVPFGMT